ncbi:MAG: GNAT family N-acetyltransferase [Pirellulaceae bacterium]
MQNLGVTPAHRGRGLGQILLWHALRGFTDLGIERSSLEVTAPKLKALELYQRLGFRTTKTVYKAIDVAFA